MPRHPRHAPGGFVYYVLNHAIARHALLKKDLKFESCPFFSVALVFSVEWLEVAVNRGDAARQLDARVGTPVTIEWKT